MSKAVIVVLVLIAVLFVVFFVVGVGNHDPKNQPTAANINKRPMPSIVGRLGQVFGSRGPKLDAAHMHPALTTFDLQKQGSYTIVVSPDADNPVRQAEFKVTGSKSCAHLVFTASNGAPGELKLQDTASNDPNKQPPDPNAVTFSIPKQGGSLVIERKQPLNATPCTVTLK